MAQKPFAGAHTAAKLNKLEAYLKAYLNVFKNAQWAHKIYFDAFAGTGAAPIAGRSAPVLELGSEDSGFVVGSVRRVLGLDLTFSEYVFVEKNRNKAKELELVVAEYPGKAGRVSIVRGDANSALQSFCAERDWSKCRAVVFLDPFGNQVKWKTIEAIAGTRRIDLWYLFPAGLGVHRQMSKGGSVHYTHEKSLDDLFGTPKWRQEFIGDEEDEPDLFNRQNRHAVKMATPTSITRFMIGRMKGVFQGGVLDEWLTLGPRNHHSYSLLFAWGNPSQGAKKAGDIARAVMRSGKHGRTKRH